MSKVLLKYWFIFDPSEVWPRQDSFNSDLNSMLRARGLVAEKIERVINDDEGEEVILYITIDKTNPPEPPQPSKELQPELKEALEQSNA